MVEQAAHRVESDALNAIETLLVIEDRLREVALQLLVGVVDAQLCGGGNSREVGRWVGG